MSEEPIGARIRRFREGLGLTQEGLAVRADLGHLQTVSDIERGGRSLRAAEVERVARALQRPVLEVLGVQPESTPIRLAWRLSWEDPCVAPGGDQAAAELERRRLTLEISELARAGRWLERLCDEPARDALPLHRIPAAFFAGDASPRAFTWARSLARRFRDVLDLGARPARTIAPLLESRFGVLIVERDFDESVGSGASFRHEELAGILLNSRQPPSRRAFSLAHELFHLLTWDPDDGLAGCAHKPPVERFADAFASEFLLPEPALRADFERSLSPDRGASFVALCSLAMDYGVSVEALLWRLHWLGYFRPRQVEEALNSLELRSVRREVLGSRIAAPGQRFPTRFISFAYRAHALGRISRGKLAGLLECGLLDLDEFLERQLGPIESVTGHEIKASLRGH